MNESTKDKDIQVLELLAGLEKEHPGEFKDDIHFVVRKIFSPHFIGNPIVTGKEEPGAFGRLRNLGRRATKD